MSYTPKHSSDRPYTKSAADAKPAARSAADTVPNDAPDTQDYEKYSEGGKKNQKVLVYSVIGILLATAVVALVFMLTSGLSGNKNGTVGTRHDVTITANGGSMGSQLEGTWKLDEITSYEFDGSGRGVLHTAMDFPFAYSADNNLLEVDFDNDDGRDSEYRFTVSGQTLTLSRDGNSMVLTKIG